MRFRSLLTILVVHLVTSQSVAQDTGTTGIRGSELFMDLCSGCHGEDASGGNAPNIQQAPRKQIAEALDGIEEMPEFDLSPSEIDALARFLSTLD